VLNSKALSLANYPVGIYFIQLSAHGKPVFTEKVIKR